MTSGANDDVEIAGRAPVLPSIALARNANPLPVARACLDANLERFGAADHAFTVARRANGNILSAAVALRADPRLLDVAAAPATRANVLAGDIQTHYSAANRRPERHVHLIFEIAARLRARGSSAGAARASAEDAGEDVTKSAATRGAAPAPCTFVHVSEIEAAEVESAAGTARARPGSGLRPRKSAKPSRSGGSPARVGLGGGGIDVVGIKAELVVNFALLGIAQNVVGFRDGLEFFFGRFVSGIDIGMIFTRKLTEGFANVFRRGGFLDAENFVIVFFGCRHFSLTAVEPGLG